MKNIKVSRCAKLVHIIVSSASSILSHILCKNILLTAENKHNQLFDIENEEI